MALGTHLLLAKEGETEDAHFCSFTGVKPNQETLERDLLPLEYIYLTTNWLKDNISAVTENSNYSYIYTPNTD